MSLGGLPSAALKAAIHRAVDENLIVLAAAGNCVGWVVARRAPAALPSPAPTPPMRPGRGQRAARRWT